MSTYKILDPGNVVFTCAVKGDETAMQYYSFDNGTSGLSAAWGGTFCFRNLSSLEKERLLHFIKCCELDKMMKFGYLDNQAALTVYWVSGSNNLGICFYDNKSAAQRSVHLNGASAQQLCCLLAASINAAASDKELTPVSFGL